MASLFIGHGAIISGRLATRLGAIIAAGALAAVTLPVGVLAGPPSSAGAVEVSAAVRHDVSPPLRNLRPSAPSAANLREQPLRSIGGRSTNGPDGALQTTAGPTAAPTAGLGFAGVGQGDYGFTDAYAPPDTNGAVGATQYVQWVNVNFAVFDKTTGAKVLGPVAGNTLWSGFGGGCQTNNNGDPIVQYDKAANRWIMTQFSVSTTPYLQCVAVSTTSDATGSYNRYAFSFGNTQFPDYPKLGVWPDGYYLSFNIFNGGRTWAGAKACALDRNAMLVGAAATMQCFQLSTSFGGLLPSDLDGKIAPPAGSPDFFLNYGSNSLNLWKFHADFATPANSTFAGPTSIPVASFSAACGGGTCIPQPSTTQQLDSLADRLMYRLAYRHFADGHEALVVNHSVTAGTSTGIRWYELRNPSSSTMAAGTPVVFQQGTYAPDSSYRWMGSIAMDGAGDIAVGYSVSSSSVSPSIRYTGRVPTDALGTLESEATIKAGNGSQLQTLSRWGDYSAMTVDPADDCTFWYTNEYLKTSGTFNWSTWITSSRFAGCGSADFGLSATPTSQTVTQGSGTSYSVTVTPSGGFTGSVNLSVSGLPSGAGGLFSPTATTASSILTVTTTSSTPTGIYLLTITGTSGSLVHTTAATLVVAAAPVITSLNSATFTVGSAGSFTVTSSGFPTPTISETGVLPGGVTFTANANGTATLAGTPASGTGGTYPMTFTAVNGVGSATQSFTLTVDQAPAITSSASTTFTVGSPGSFTVTSTGFPIASLVQGGATLPSGLAFTDKGDGTGTLQGTPGAGTAGTYALTFTAHNGIGPDAVQTFTLTVNPTATPDFSLSATPTSQTVTQGSGTSYTVTVTPSGGFAGSVNLSVSGLPSGASGSFSANPTTGSSTLTVTTSSSTPTGTYPLTITGTSGSLVHTTAATLVVVAAPAGDFSLSVSPSTRSITHGSSTSYTVTVTPSGGFAGSVNLSVSGLPSGASGSFSANPTTGSSTLTVTTASSTPTGTYPLTVTGTSGSLIHTTTATLKIR